MAEAEDNKQPEEVKEVKTETAEELNKNRTEFFIGELARMEQDNIRRYQSLGVRIALLERKGKPADDDPMKMFGSIMLVMIGLQVLPIIAELIARKWGSSSSSELSA